MTGLFQDVSFWLISEDRLQHDSVLLTSDQPCKMSPAGSISGDGTQSAQGTHTEHTKRQRTVSPLSPVTSKEVVSRHALGIRMFHWLRHLALQITHRTSTGSVKMRWPCMSSVGPLDRAESVRRPEESRPAAVPGGLIGGTGSLGGESHRHRLSG